MDVLSCVGPNLRRINNALKYVRAAKSSVRNSVGVLWIEEKTKILEDLELSERALVRVHEKLRGKKRSYGKSR